GGAGEMGGMYPEDYRARELSRKHGIDLETAKRIQKEIDAGVHDWFRLGMGGATVMIGFTVAVLLDPLLGYGMILAGVLVGASVFWEPGKEE
nr:hypothetical protein [Methanoculleus sp.]